MAHRNGDGPLVEVPTSSKIVEKAQDSAFINPVGSTANVSKDLLEDWLATYQSLAERSHRFLWKNCLLARH